MVPETSRIAGSFRPRKRAYRACGRELLYPASHCRVSHARAYASFGQRAVRAAASLFQRDSPLAEGIRMLCDGLRRAGSADG